MISAADTAALTADVARGELVAFRAREAKSRRWNDSSWIAIGIVIVIGVVVGGMPLVNAVIGLADGEFSLGSLLFPTAVFGAAAIVAVVIRAASWGTWERRFRLTRFAEANGLYYHEPADEAPYQGAAFGLGRSRSRDAVFTTTDGPAAEFGSYRWTTGSGKHSRTHRIGYVALQLERPLPHMVLDARGNNRFFASGVIPFSFDRDQVLSLEGDFDDYFTLYCPSDYERDALYVFTPDVMALLIDESSHLDVEIVDDWVFFYSTTPFDFAAPATWQRFERIGGTVVAKLRRVAGRYRDDRADSAEGSAPAGASASSASPAGTWAPSASAHPLSGAAAAAPRGGRAPLRIAAGGRRLRSGTPWLAIGVVVAVVVVWNVAAFLFSIGG